MKKNQLTTTKSSAVMLGRSKSLMNITKKILEGSNKGLVKANTRQDLTTHKDITIIGDLMWEKETQYNENEMDWYEAIKYANNLRLGGYDDWRLPTIEELLEVVILCGGRASTPDDLLDSADDLDDYMKKMRTGSDGEHSSLCIFENTISYQENYKEKGFKEGYTYESECELFLRMEEHYLAISYWTSSIVGNEGFVFGFKYGSFSYWALDSTCGTAIRCVRGIS